MLLDRKLQSVTAFALIQFVLLNFNGILGQIASHPVVLGRLNESAVLSCDSGRIPLRLCFWEQTENDNLILTFDTSSSLVRVNGSVYSYIGQGLGSGKCSLKIGAIKDTDFQRWKCTLLARDDNTSVFRGIVLLQESGPQPFPKGVNVGNFPSDQDQIKSNSFSIPRQPEGRARPVVTAEGSVSVSSSQGQGSRGVQIQEVEVQSAGLVIIPRRSRKLIIL